MMKNQRNTNKGITLIALVITIIVLLILAGVALATLTGDSGILNNAENAKEETLKANVKEKVQLAIMEHKVGQYSEGKTLKEYLVAAGATDVTETGTKGKMDGYNFEIVDGVVTVTKESSNQLTLGDVYTEDMIMQEINYKTADVIADDIKWIIIGQDEDGNVLATTNRPIGITEDEESYTFNVKGNVGTWLTYEENLNNHCENIFFGTAQGRIIKAKSMNLNHVNALTGFIEPAFNTYTFKDQETSDYENKILNFYHPDINGTATEEEIERRSNQMEQKYTNI